MSGRDLLYKPNVPLVIPEESSTTKPASDRGNVLKPSKTRELGSVGEAPVAPPPQPQVRETSQTKAPAFKAAYFNQDTSGVREANLRQRNLQALRGAEGASDLRKVVLPPAIGVETPNPVQLRQAGELMGLDGALELSLSTFLGRQNGWARARGVTVEMIKERLLHLETMVAARKAALARMAQGRAKQPATSVTVVLAKDAKGQALDQVEDVARAGAELVQRTAGQAEGMHKRLAKVLGIKR